jgi:hypothetical protein
MPINGNHELACGPSMRWMPDGPARYPQAAADVHLAALAAMRKGRLVTFDRGIANALRPADRAIIELLPIT